MLKPLNDWILIEADKTEEKTDTGLLVGKVEGDRTEAIAIKGKVIATAPNEVVGDPKNIIVGSTVWVAKWEVHKVYYQGKEYLIIKREHILAVEND